MTFRTRNDHSSAAEMPSPAGERLVTKYRRKIGEDGILHLVEDGTEDIYLAIQAATDPSGIYGIIDAYVRTGDVNVINTQRGVFADVSSSPRSLAELEQLRIDSRERFYSLPLDIRNIFHNNPEEFVANSQRALQAMEGIKKPGTPSAAQKQDGASSSADGAANNN